MLDTTLIVLCAGDSTRFGLQPKKQWLRCNDEPLWLYVTKRLSNYHNFEKIIIVGHIDELNYMQNYTDDFIFVAGGNTRQESMINGLQNVTSSYVMITDVARCCTPKIVIEQLIQNRTKADCIVPYLNVSDTVVYNDCTIKREDVKLIQTPQLSSTDILKKALKDSDTFTDDSSAIKDIKGTVYYIKGSSCSKKLTFGDEINDIQCLPTPSFDTFVGTGIDIHPFEKNKQMVLGGVEIDCEYGFKAHSDGDVLIHSVIDALLGAIGAGDIGDFFPDTDAQYKNADSKELLKNIVKFVSNVGYKINNIDLTIIAQIPKINPHKMSIKTTLSKLINIPKYKINIKATTAEELGFIGRKEAIAVQSVATLKYYDWTK